MPPFSTEAPVHPKVSSMLRHDQYLAHAARTPGIHQAKCLQIWGSKNHDMHICSLDSISHWIRLCRYVNMYVYVCVCIEKNCISMFCSNISQFDRLIFVFPIKKFGPFSPKKTVWRQPQKWMLKIKRSGQINLHFKTILGCPWKLVTSYIVNWFITYLRDLQLIYIEVIIYLLSTMEISIDLAIFSDKSHPRPPYVIYFSTRAG